MIRTAEILIFLIASITLLSAVWIIVPAPAESIWLFAVAVSEWSLWIAIIALTSIVPSLFSLVFKNGGKIDAVSLVVAVAAVGITLYPFASTLGVARENAVPLSLIRYFAGVKTLGASAKAATPITHTFAQIDGKNLELDVYLPTQTNANNGASVVVVHGGAWVRGVRSDFPQWNQRLAEAGFTVFDIDYRLVQPNYLTATGDVKCAMGWVEQHAAEFSISPSRIAFLGRSAGAQLALLAAYSDDGRIPSSCAERGNRTNVRAVVSIYSPVDLLWDYDNPANQSVIDGPQTLADFLGGSPHSSDEIRERYVLASPSTQIDPTTPPTLVIHGGQDQLVRPENLDFLAQKLSESNVPHQTLKFPYAQHGFDYNINGWGSQVTETVMLDFLAKYTAVE